MEDIDFAELRTALLKRTDSKAFREKLYDKFGTATANASDILEKIILQDIYYLKEHPEYNGWFFTYGEKINYGFKRTAKTITNVLKGFQDIGILKYIVKKKNIASYRENNPGLDRLLTDNPYNGKETPYFIYLNIKALNIKALTEDIKQPTIKTKERLYAEGMDKEREWNSKKEKRDAEIIPENNPDPYINLREIALRKKLQTTDTLEPDIFPSELTPDTTTDQEPEPYTTGIVRGPEVDELFKNLLSKSKGD